MRYESININLGASTLSFGKEILKKFLLILCMYVYMCLM